jgi:Flp pilus assembly protein TadB
MIGLDSTAALAALLGTGAGVGVLLVATGLRPHQTAIGSPAEPGRLGRWSRLDPRRQPHGMRRLAVCVGAGLLVAVVTRWPVAALLAAVAVWALPRLIGPDRDHRRRVDRIEAIATWTESLRDTLQAAAGLEQAIMATAPLAPDPIRAEVELLVERLRGGQRLPAALRAFAADLDDATGDLVVAALVMAAERHARRLAELLTSLATAARDEASLRMRIAASRARVRTSTRVITTVTLTMATGLVVFNRSYLHPYDTPFGQLILLAVGGLFALGFWWLSRIARPFEPARALSTVADSPVARGFEVVRS